MFKRGDIVKFEFNSDAASKTMQNKRNALKNMNCRYLVIMKVIEENEYLVAVCRDTETKKKLCFKTNCGELFVSTRAFYPVDGSCLVLCEGLGFIDGSLNVVDEIYAEHNRRTEAKKRAKELKRKKEKEATKKANMEKKRQHDLEMKYKRAYQVAVINNDRDKMQEIVEIVGYAPGLGSGRGRKSGKNQKAPYETTNPKPFSGGGFCPK